MPTVSVPLSSISKQLVTSSIYNIAREISDIIKVSNTLDIITLYNGDEITYTDGKVNISNKKVDNLPTTVSTRRLLVNISDNYSEDALTTTATHQEEYFPIFIDNDIEVTIFPIYVQTEYNIEFTYYTLSKSEIGKVIEDIRVRLSQSRNITIHDIEYNYFLPVIIEEFIYDVYNNKNRLYEQPLEEYFREHTTKRLHLTSDLIGGNNELAIREKQIRVVGLFDFSPLPEKAERDLEVYKFTFNYKFTIDKPTHLVMKYPIMVCNKLLPNKYIEFLLNKDDKEERRRNLSYSNSLYALSNFEAHRQLENRVDINLPINVPSIDDFKIKTIHKGYGITTSFLIDIDEADKQTLFNLTKIDPFQIHPIFLQYMELEKEYIVAPYASFIYLGLYQDNVHFNNDVLTITPDFTIMSKSKLQLCKTTRVLLNYIVDLSMLNENALKRLMTYSNDIIKYVLLEFISNAINFKDSITNKDEYRIHRVFLLILHNLLNKDSFSLVNDILETMAYQDRYMFDKLLEIIYSNYPDTFSALKKHSSVVDRYINKGGYKNYEDTSNLFMKTVQTSYIVALRREA